MGPLPAKFAAARAAARTNRQFIDAMLAAFDEENEESDAPAHLRGARAEAARIGAAEGRCPPGDAEKVGLCGGGGGGPVRWGLGLECAPTTDPDT